MGLDRDSLNLARISVQLGIEIQKERISIRQTRKKENKVKPKKLKETGKKVNCFPGSCEDGLRSLGANVPENIQDGGVFGRIQTFSLVVYFTKMYGSSRLGFY